MIRVFYILMMVIMFGALSSDAAVYKGQREYIKNCKKCHNNGQRLAASKKMREWKKLLKKKGKVLAAIHLKDKHASKSWKYFQSRKYIKRSRHLKDFMVEYARDSGNVPACD